MVRGTLVAILLFLAGCAAQQVSPEVTRLLNWQRPAKAQAKAGQMKWSDYYKGLFSHLEQLPDTQTKTFYLRGTNILINASLAKEEGRISSQQFESLQREMISASSEFNQRIQAENAARRSQNTAARGRAAMAYGQFLQKQAAQSQAWQRNQSISCNSQRFGNMVTTNCQ